MTSEPSRNVDIEALRIIALAITLAFHFGFLNPGWWPALFYFWLGGGVDLFFAISGYVITSSLLRQQQTTPGFWRAARAFWIRRMFRLWPAAIICSTATVILALNFNPSGTFGQPADIVATWIASVFQVVNAHLTICLQAKSCIRDSLGHYWSLSLEEQFYFVFPFVLFLSPRRYLLPLVLVAAAVQMTMVRPWPSFSWFFRTDAILLGIAVALSRPYLPRGIIGLLDRKPVALCLTAVLLVCLVITATPIFTPFYMGLTAAISGALVLTAALVPTSIVPQAAHQATIYLAARTYSMYLVHNPVFSLTRELSVYVGLESDARPAIACTLAIIATVVAFLLADCSYRFIETPLRNYGRRLSEGSGRAHSVDADFAR